MSRRVGAIEMRTLHGGIQQCLKRPTPGMVLAGADGIAGTPGQNATAVAYALVNSNGTADETRSSNILPAILPIQIRGITVLTICRSHRRWLWRLQISTSIKRSIPSFRPRSMRTARLE